MYAGRVAVYTTDQAIVEPLLYGDGNQRKETHFYVLTMACDFRHCGRRPGFLRLRE
jgi:hypothetical protein